LKAGGRCSGEGEFRGSLARRSISVRRTSNGEIDPNQQQGRPVESKLTFSAGHDRLSIGLTSNETGLTYHLHMSEAEAQRFAVFVAERSKVRA
jgi:hypothetical protein